MIELAYSVTQLRLLGIVLLDAPPRQPVEQAKLLLPQAFVDLAIEQPGPQLTGLGDVLGRLARAQVGGNQQDIRLFIGRQVAEPVAQRRRLLDAQRAQGHVHVARADVDALGLCCLRDVVGDVAGTLSMPDDPQILRPFLLH